MILVKMEKMNYLPEPKSTYCKGKEVKTKEQHWDSETSHVHPVVRTQCEKGNIHSRSRESVNAAACEPEEGSQCLPKPSFWFEFCQNSSQDAGY